MPRPSIEYINARRAAKAAAGGTNYANETDRERQYRIADELARDRDEANDGYIIAMKAIGDFSLSAELSRQQLVARLGIPQHETVDEIPF